MPKRPGCVSSKRPSSRLNTPTQGSAHRSCVRPERSSPTSRESKNHRQEQKR
nr:MAG TPA: hypothetical protein [Caudoviricetes sp.]